MKKRKIGIILLTLLIAAMAIVPIVSAVDASENSNQFGTVSVSKKPADEVAITS